MGNSKVQTTNENIRKPAECTNYAFDTQKQILNTTSQRKAPSKIEITITRQQLIEAKWLFNQAGKQKPNWLRQKFYINQRRRKCLNTELAEAQLDRAFCNRCHNTNEWYDLLHLLWHAINGSPSCV